MDGLDERTLYGIPASKTNLNSEAFVTIGFRLHVVVLNDPVRRSVVHLVQSWLLPSYAFSVVGYECAKFDPTDPVFNPMWRQGRFVPSRRSEFMVAMYEFTNCSAVLHAIQWLRYSIGESAALSMCLQCYLWLPRWIVLSLCR